MGRAFIHAVCAKPSHQLVSVCQLVPDRGKIDEDHRAENREPFKYAEGADRRGCDGPHQQPSIRDERGDPSQHQIDGHKVVLAPHDVKYSREDHDQRQAEASKRRELRFDSGHRRQDQADASKKLTDPDEDEQVLRHRGKPRHFMERLVPQGRLVTENFAEAGDAEEGPHHTWVVQSTAFKALFASVVGALFCDPLDSRLLSRLRRPVGRFNTKLLGVLRVQPLPAELHRLTTNDAADGSSAEKPIQNIESFVGSKKGASRALRTRRRPSTSTPPVLYKSRDGRVLTPRSEHHRERLAKCLDASWI